MGSLPAGLQVLSGMSGKEEAHCRCPAPTIGRMVYFPCKYWGVYDDVKTCDSSLERPKLKHGRTGHWRLRQTSSSQAQRAPEVAVVMARETWHAHEIIASWSRAAQEQVGTAKGPQPAALLTTCTIVRSLNWQPPIFVIC